MNIKRILLLLVIIITPVSADNVVTLPATSVDTDSATLSLNLSNLTNGYTTAWFEYGGNENSLRFRTAYTNRSNGSYSVTINSFPLIAGQTFYYRGMATSLTGNMSNFTLTGVSAFTDYNFDAIEDDFLDAGFNLSEQVETLPLVYEDLLGTLFWGIIFALIFIIMWIRQEDVTNPAILGIIISVAIFTMTPVEYLKVGYALLIVSIAGIIVSIIFKK